jgi:hypothetical protein
LPVSRKDKDGRNQGNNDASNDDGKVLGNLILDQIHNNPTQKDTGEYAKEYLDFCTRILLLSRQPETNGILENESSHVDSPFETRTGMMKQNHYSKGKFSKQLLIKQG